MGVSRTVCLALLILSLVGGGCTTAWVQEHRLAPTGLAPEDTIAVILAAPVKDELSSELENQVTECVQGALSGIQPGIRIISPNQLRKLALRVGGRVHAGLDLQPEWPGGRLRDCEHKIAPLGL